MLNQIAAVGLAALAAAGGPETVRDTSFTAPEGMRLEVQNETGYVHVRGVDGDRVHIESRTAPYGAIRVRRSGSVVRVSPSERWREEADVEELDLRIEVPRGADVRLEGSELEIFVEDVAGAVEAENSDDGITVRGPARSVRAHSSDGDVNVRGSRGAMDLYTADGDVRVEDVEGELRAESIDGDLMLRDVRSALVEATTTDGDILFEGSILERGQYRLDAHDGSIWMAVSQDADAAFDVNVHDGEFDASFGLPSLDTVVLGRHYRFVLGEGSARVELSTFDGEIYLRRPGELPDEGMPFEE